MAWAVKYRGYVYHDYMVADSWIPSGNNWEFEFEFTIDAITTSNSVAFSNGSHTDGIYINYSFAGTPGFYCGGAKKTPSTFVAGETYLAKLVSTSGNVEYFINGVSLGTANTTCNPAITKLNIARRVQTSAQEAEITVSKLKFTDFDDGTNSRDYDFNSSDHSNTGVQPVVIDTIGSNNATGVNLPTDGSAWVDLGGGVSVNVSDSLSESASSANNDSIVYVGEFSVLETSSNSSGLANQDSISFASSVNISDAVNNSLTVANNDNIYLVGELVVNDLTVGSISSANQDGVTLAATISVNDSLINSISLAINDSMKLSGAFDVIEQLANSSASANNDLVAFSSTVSVSDQSSNSQSDSINDEVSFIGAFSVSDQLTNSLSLANVDLISFTGEVILTDGVVNSASLSNSDFIQIGAFNFTVYKETNISSTFKSRNIDSPSLSTNIDG